MLALVSLNLWTLLSALANRGFLLRPRFGIGVRSGELEGGRHVLVDGKVAVPGFFLGVESCRIIRGGPDMENDLRLGPRSRCYFARLDIGRARRGLGPQLD